MTEKQNAAVGFRCSSLLRLPAGATFLCDDYVTYDGGGAWGGPQIDTPPCI